MHEGLDFSVEQQTAEGKIPGEKGNGLPRSRCCNALVDTEKKLLRNATVIGSDCAAWPRNCYLHPEV